MIWNMVHFSELEPLGASKQLLAYSEAYLESAGHLCGILAATPAESNYPRSAVVLSLTFHGIELFLKAAILEKAPNEQFSDHNLDHLGKRYEKLYPAKKHTFDILFRDEEIVLDDPDPLVIKEFERQIAELKRATPTDQLHRYPQDIKGDSWKGLYSFEASSFAGDISKVQQRVARLKELIFNS
jgi:hypothetical protein